MKKIIPVLVIFAVVTSCKNNPKTGASVKSETDDIRFAGNNVTSEYQRRSEGYDWVAVKLSEITDSILQISVRSLHRYKKPTCTFDVKVYETESGRLVAILKGKTYPDLMINRINTVSK